MILFMGNSEEQIIIQEEYTVLLNTGSKSYYADERKYISQIYKVMLIDTIDRQNIQNWASLVRNT